ncbi:hypothetical protein [Armatimonas sp.]|uniref:hypothetical protein n=1 Tax=Armatimonas sp. TaxID=1872638 RepID=UPI003751C0F9
MATTTCLCEAEVIQSDAENERLNTHGEYVNNDVQKLSQEAAMVIGLQLPIESYDASKHHPLCKSGRELANDLRPVLPGMARAIDHRVAAVEEPATKANDARIAAYEELVADIKRLLARAAMIHERQPKYLRMLEELEEERVPKRKALAKAASLLEITLNPTTISVESVTAALRREVDYGPRPVPVPGAPKRAEVIGLAITKILAPLFLSIPISLAVGTLTGVIPLSTLQDLDALTPTIKGILICFWLLGAALHHLLIISGAQNGKLHARAKFEGHVEDRQSEVSLRAAAWWCTVGLLFLWVVISLLEGFGLHQMALDFAFVGDSEAPPLWVFFIIGSAINGAILFFASYLSFTDSARELAKKWPWKREEHNRPPEREGEGELRQDLMEAACQLIDLNAKVAKLEGKLRADEAALAEKPQISALALQRIADAEAEVSRKSIPLRELLDYVCRRMGTLSPMLLLVPFHKVGLLLRGEKFDPWPEA